MRHRGLASLFIEAGDRRRVTMVGFGMLSRAALRAPGFVGSTIRPTMPVLTMAKQLHVSKSVLLPALVGANAKQEQPNTKLLPFVVGAGMLTVLSQNSYGYSESMGKKRKKDSVLADDMYEVDFIVELRCRSSPRPRSRCSPAP